MLYNKASSFHKILIPFMAIGSVLLTVSLIIYTNLIMNLIEPYVMGIENRDLVINTINQLRLVIFGGSIIFAVTLFILLLVLFSALVWLWSRAIGRLTIVANGVARGDLNQRVEVSHQDELGQLGETFNEMISNLKESSAGILIEKKRSEALIQGLPEGIILTDSNNNIVMINRAVRKILGLHAGEMIEGGSIEQLNNIEIAANIQAAGNAEAYTATRELNVVSPRYRDRRTYRMVSYLIRAENTELDGTVTVLEDITAERELRDLRDGFLRTISHELRTPLTSIIGFIDLVRVETNITPRQKKCLDVALNCALNLKSLINDLLDLTRIEAGKMEIILISLDFRDLVDDVMESVVPWLSEKNISAVNKVQESLPLIRGDREKIRRVLINLISNALKFTEQGSIQVSAEVVNQQVLVVVEDTGIGIREEQLGVIFEKFRQIDYSSTRKYEGIGLGLNIVKELIELHGGKVWAESTLGNGSQFYFTLPLADSSM